MEDHYKYAVQAVLLSHHGEVCVVSRKTDHYDFGLPGGKVDPTDISLEAAIVREVKEETGLDIDMETSSIIFAMHRGGYMGFTYLIRNWKGMIKTDEPHIVTFLPFSKIIEGSFGEWNELVAQSLESMGVNIKRNIT